MIALPAAAGEVPQAPHDPDSLLATAEAEEATFPLGITKDERQLLVPLHNDIDRKRDLLHAHLPFVREERAPGPPPSALTRQAATGTGFGLHLARHPQPALTVATRRPFLSHMLRGARKHERDMAAIAIHRRQ